MQKLLLSSLKPVENYKGRLAVGANGYGVTGRGGGRKGVSHGRC